MAGDSERFDIAVIGAGIAGASVACELAATNRVVLLERESQPGYHTTGRSAALFSETYGPPVIRALSRASARWFDAPPQNFTEVPLLNPRGVLLVARADQRAVVEGMLEDATVRAAARRISADEARGMQPLLRSDYAAEALYEPGARDIDVHALHNGYLRIFRARGGIVRTDAEVRTVERNGESWTLETTNGTIEADILINAAGAWADEVAALAGAAPVGLVPKRRTAVIVAAPVEVDASHMPMVVDVAEEFYLKPDAGRLLISPADETPSPPCDAQPEEIDIAICVDRIERAFDLQVRRIENRWAGLRSFVADKCPVAGFDPDRPGFFWLAGQGGYGIQTAPALARTAAALVEGRPIPADIASEGVDAAMLAPGRLGAAA